MTSQTPTPVDPQLPQKIMAIVTELDSVLETEIDLLKKFQYKNHPELLRRKQELALHYQTSLKALTDVADKKALINEETKARLTAAGKKLEDTTRRNAEALRAAQFSTEYLLNTVMKEIKSELARESGYSKGGTMATEEKPTTRPVALNQRV